MSDNIKILKNYLLYFLLMILLCMVGVSGVFAETLTGMKFANRYYNQFPFSTNYEPYTYYSDYFTFRGTEGTPNYMILNVCGTGLLDFNISNASGQFKYLGYVEQANKSCTTQGYSGYEYIYYFNFVNFDDAGGGDLGVSFNNTITNAYGYNTYVTFKSITFSNTSNLDVLKQQQDIINQNSQNTSEIINNQNTTTQNIINNQNENTEKEIESQQVCEYIDVNSIIIDNKALDGNGIFFSHSNYGITDYINIQSSTIKVVTSTGSGYGPYYCFYNINKEKISCTNISNLVTDTLINIPVNSVYFRTSIFKNSNRPTFNICKNGNQALNDSITGLNDSLNDDDSSGATSEASDFFNSFTTNTFGLTSIITAPLNLIQSLTSSTCSELHLPLPYLNNKYLDLPCMTSIYQTHFGAFFTMYQTITYGIIAYWVCVRIFNQVKDFKNPEHDEIEVVDL